VTYLAICPWNGQALPVRLAPKHRALWWQGGPVGDGVEVVARWSGGVRAAWWGAPEDGEEGWHRHRAGVRLWTLRRIVRRLYGRGWGKPSILVTRADE
jgi:hypothetical protein